MRAKRDESILADLMVISLSQNRTFNYIWITEMLFFAISFVQGNISISSHQFIKLLAQNIHCLGSFFGKGWRGAFFVEEI